MKNTEFRLMKYSPVILAVALWIGTMCVAASAEGAPKLQFDQTLYDFGKTSMVTSVSGVFKFKNVGDAVLKLEPPKPSCGCTVAAVKPDTLAPGETGELDFSLNLGLNRATLEKHIAVRSNDPQNPNVSLSIKVDYTPLYELSPVTLSPDLAFGSSNATQFTTLTRSDGKPLQIARLDPSQPRITATVEPGKADSATARIRVVIQRNGPPRRFNEYIHIYGSEQTNTPVSSIYIYGEVRGEVSLSQEALYWSITDPKPSEDVATRRIMIRSATGQPLELKNPQCSLKGIKVELVPKEPGKVYELIARLDDVPSSTVSGNVTFETSVAAVSKIELPIIVNVFKTVN